MSHNPTPDTQHPTPASPLLRLLPWEQIVPNPHQPRKRFTTLALQELADSIRQHGILQPLLVCQIAPDRYQLIAGERRHRAARMVGLTAVPTIVQQADDQQQTEIALIENLQREDLTPVEAARAFRILMNDHGLTQDELSRRTGKSQPVISRIIRLLQLPEPILDALQRCEILERHTRALLTLKDRQQREKICRQVLEERLSASETELRVRAVLAGAISLEPPLLASDTPTEPSPATENANYCLDYQTLTMLILQLTAHFNTDVDVGLGQNETSYITIECHSPAHLRRMVEALMKTEV